MEESGHLHAQAVRCRHWVLFWTTSILSPLSRNIYLKNLILYSYLHRFIQIFLSVPWFRTKFVFLAIQLVISAGFSGLVAARLLRLWVKIPPEKWMFACCECCVLSGTGLFDELITRPEGSYLMWCVVLCDLETSRMRRPWPALGRSTTRKKKSNFILIVLYLSHLISCTATTSNIHFANSHVMVVRNSNSSAQINVRAQANR